MNCLDEKTLSSYLDKNLTKEEREGIEVHIAECRDCLDLITVAYQAQSSSEKCPAQLKEKLRQRFGFKKTKKTAERWWFYGTVLMFVFSFVFRGYFMQFLALTIILGFKWVMEGEGARKVVMIFKGIEKEEKKEKKN